MATLLVIESSPRSASVSTSLLREYVAQWQRKHPDGRVIRHNVATEAVPYIDETWMGAVYTPTDARTEAQQKALALSDQFITELEEADTILLGVPMYNFGIPASLKSWFDQIIRAGRTFTYTADGPKGLLDSNKKVVIAASRGGAYSGNSPLNFLDQQEPYVRTVLNFIGLSNIHIAYAEGQAMGEEAALLGVKTATDSLLALV